jgi:hypothetical protein
VLDELGYLSYDARAADLLFQVVGRRYERKSLVLTTNLAFSDWPTIFPNAGSAIALIDRLIHHAEIITIEGESYPSAACRAHSEALPDQANFAITVLLLATSVAARLAVRIRVLVADWAATKLSSPVQPQTI